VNAINIASPAELEQFFFQAEKQVFSPRTAVIMHCEFSQHRGPKSYVRYTLFPCM